MRQAQMDPTAFCTAVKYTSETKGARAHTSIPHLRRISKGVVDLQPHPNTSFSFSNPAGHVALSLGAFSPTGGRGARPRREDTRWEKAGPRPTEGWTRPTGSPSRTAWTRASRAGGWPRSWAARPRRWPTRWRATGPCRVGRTRAGAPASRPRARARG